MDQTQWSYGEISGRKKNNVEITKCVMWAIKSIPKVKTKIIISGLFEIKVWHVSKN